jgi:hypothetical protein
MSHSKLAVRPAFYHAHECLGFLKMHRDDALSKPLDSQAQPPSVVGNNRYRHFSAFVATYY